MHVYLTARPRSFELTEAIRHYVEKRLIHAVESHAPTHDLVRLEVHRNELGTSKGDRD